MVAYLMAKEPKDTVKKGPSFSKAKTDFALLTVEDREELIKQAEQALLDERKQQASTEFFDKELERLRRTHIPDEQYIHITIDAAPYVPYFMIDGTRYYCGYTYEVTRKQAAVLDEQMQRSWLHQNEIDGRSRFTSYRRERADTIGRAQEGTSTRGFAPGVRVEAEII
jgi:hypothetical protein